MLGGVRLSEIAEKAGTPTFVYNAEVIRRQFRTLDTAPHRSEAPGLFRSEGQQQPRRAPGAT